MRDKQKLKKLQKLEEKREELLTVPYSERAAGHQEELTDLREKINTMKKRLGL